MSVSEAFSKDDTMFMETEQASEIEYAQATITADSVGERVKGRPNRSQMLPIRGWKVHEPVLGAIILPLKLARFPIVL
jgi:hypothetical protein